MKRREDWPARLTRYVTEKALTPFAWGTNDCVQFAAGWVEECTGERVLSIVYSDEKSGLRKLQELGGLAAATTQVLGEPLIGGEIIHRGDIALLMNDGRPCLGVVMGTYVVSPGETRLSYHPRSQIMSAWRI